ncbi:MAG TPA: putative porin [Terriglobales bacterium]|nr:putative porin [Terriglobales bacterium]
MQKALIWIFLLIFAAAYSLAQTNIATNAAQNNTDTHSSTASSASSQADSDLRSEVEELKRLVQEQQKHIDKLEAERTQSEVVAPPVAALAGKESATSQSVPDTQATAATAASQDAKNQNAGSSDERIRNLERQIKGIGPISFSGDARLREEPFFGGPADRSLQRARLRYRVRFNAVADLGPQFRTGLSLASGDINDPISTNQNLTGFYTRKPIALDQFFIEYKPGWWKQFSFVGGKFRYPWYNTELTWDKDLNPEGAAQTLAFKLNTPVLKRVAFVGFELPFAEIAGTQATDKRNVQHITYGGQIQTTWQLASWLQLSAYSGFYDFRGADAIALAQARASTKNPQTAFSGVLPLANPGPQSTYITTANTVITVAGTRFPTGVTNITNAQFASRFGLFDNIARFDISTPNPKLPITILGDFVQNTEACANVAALAPQPTNTASTTFVRTFNAACNPNARRGYWLEGRVGRLQQKGDWQVGYTRIYIEREAVLGGFNYSELRQSTNVSQHRFDAFYQVDRSVQLGFTALVGRTLASTEPWLTRLQFDAAYIF